jgi:trehalose 6-phosphate phosphatase
VAESSRASDPPLDRALALARRALADAPAGLLTDFDGTLSPIVDDPASARLAGGAADALTALTRRLRVVAVVTGRAPMDARRMTGVPDLLVAGNHGTEWLEPGADTPAASPGADRLRASVREVVGRVPAAVGIEIEDKGMSATVHYRIAPDPEAARARILAAIGDPGPDVELRDGRMSVEVRPVGLGDKGAATRAIVERFGLRGAVVMGDDLTDLDMFAAVEEARQAGELRGAIVAVGGADREVPLQVIEAADVVLESPEAAARFLTVLAADTG